MTKEEKEKFIKALSDALIEPEEAKEKPEADKQPEPDYKAELDELKTKYNALEKKVNDGVLGVSNTPTAETQEKSNFDKSKFEK